MIEVENIKSPDDIKNMSIKELSELKEKIRSFLLLNISKTGGHLASNLGVVELTMALHYVFNSPYDKFIFDVGHQSYTHKILTGRAKDFPTLRMLNGLSGYIDPKESVHDIFGVGHSSTSIAIQAGLLFGTKQEGRVISIIGDGAISSGESFEAMNFLGQNQEKAPIIILNDNEMSISKNVGGLNRVLNDMRSSSIYIKTKTKTGRFFPKFIHKFKNYLSKTIRMLFHNTTLFEEFGLKYYGPIDGHNLRQLIKFFKLAKNTNKPCIIHVYTQKGKGYSNAENDKLGEWHGVQPFDIETGTLKQENKLYFGNILCDYLIKMKEENKDLKVVSPAMIHGSRLDPFKEKYPDSIIDTGITEDFAVTFSGAMTINTKYVLLSIYSTFLQRGFDQLIHDIAIQDLHLVLAIDRASIVGKDGKTHQGVFDISYIRPIPNMVLAEPIDGKELEALLKYAFEINKHPMAIRYPNVDIKDDKEVPEIINCSWTYLNKGEKINFIGYGYRLKKINEMFKKEGLNINVINARFLKPLDEDMLNELYSNNNKFIVLDDSLKTSGLGTAILEYFNEHGINVPIKILGFDDEFIPHGTVDEIFEKYHLDYKSIMELVKSYYKN